MNQELRIMYKKRNMLTIIHDSLFMIRKSSGFTLVELLIVIAVIGILAVGAISLIDPLAQIQKAQDSKRKSDLSQIQKALEIYHQDVGSYPPSSSQTSNPPYRIKDLQNNTVDWGLPWLPYMSTLPKDPSSSKNYVYVSSDTGQAYYLYASLDRGTDIKSCESAGGIKCDKAPAQCGSGYDCNYGVSSPNVSP